MTGRDAIAYLAPFTEPLRSDVFRFNRRWLQRQAGRVGDLRSPDFRTGLELNLPPQYLLVHRVTMGTLGVLCQLDADVPLRGIVRHWQPWIFSDDGADDPADEPGRPRDAARRTDAGAELRGVRFAAIFGRATAPRPRESRGAVFSGQRAREPSR